MQSVNDNLNANKPYKWKHQGPYLLKFAYLYTNIKCGHIYSSLSIYIRILIPGTANEVASKC
jgi:hypothetical protein